MMIIADELRAHGEDDRLQGGGGSQSEDSRIKAGMTDEDGARLLETLSAFGLLSSREAERLPTFMVVAPPKTGTSWLFSLLQRHPQVAVPHDKETHFFSSFYKWCDLSWYLSRFGDRAVPQRGEATPTYSILPPRTIRTIREMIPHLKLIFLFRDPVERAWSHARHNWRYHEANFVGAHETLEQVSDAAWQENFAHPWNCVSGDYLGQLRRWRSCFPREQIYVTFYEQIAAHPKELFAEVQQFLGLEIVEPDRMLLRARVNEGVPAPCSQSLRRILREMYAPRTRQLADYLWQEFRVRTPIQWNATLPAAGAPQPELTGPMRTAADHEFDDEFLFEVVQHEQRPEQPWRFGEPYLGYQMFLFRHQVYALPVPLEQALLASASAADVEAAVHAGTCLIAENVRQLQQLIARTVHERVLASQTPADDSPRR